MKKCALLFVLGCSLLAASILCGCVKVETNKIAQAGEARIKINVTAEAAARRTLVQERKILGELEAYREADLAPLVPGRVRSLPVNIGDHVKQGQIVARMDDAQLVSTIAQFQPLKAQYERSLKLSSDGAMSKAQFETTEAQYTATKRQLENLQDNTVIKAPFAGVVTARAVEEGEMYTPAMVSIPGQSKGLIRLTQLDPLKLDLDIDEQTVGKIKPGMPVKLTVDQAGDSAGIIGKVEWVNPQADAFSRTFAVRVIVPNRRLQLRPGFFAEVHIVLDEKKDILSVPREALVDNRVFVLKDSLALSMPVQVGWLTDRYAEIISGIDENAKVVISGNKALPDSARVEIANF